MSRASGEHRHEQVVLTDRIVADLGLWPTLRRLDHRARHFLGKTEVGGRDILEIGCGNGAFLIWCWANGARRCIGLEPEADGSTAGSSGVFENSIRSLDCGDNVKLFRNKLDDLSPDDGDSFDLILLYNVINHLDEGACARLKDDRTSRQRYIDTFRKLGRLVRKNGRLIIADCARSNLFRDLGMRNPLAPNIEWSKHQNPGIWKDILRAAGFVPGAIRWYQMYPLRHFGRLFANRLVAYLTYSHFVLECDKA